MVEVLNMSGMGRTFANNAMVLRNNGWSIFPQTITDRSPGRVNGRRIMFGSDYNLKDNLPSDDAIRLWSEHCPDLNVACVFGVASGNTFAVDIDILDSDLSQDIQDLADDMLGVTPLRRVGREPKIALIFRCSNILELSSISRRFVDKDEDGNEIPSENGLEIQGNGKLLTLYGIHHKTHKPFTWKTMDHPMSIRSDDPGIPTVTAEQVAEFINEVDTRYHFYRNPGYINDVDRSEWMDNDARRHTASILYSGGGEPWVEDSDGFIVDGREAFMARLCFIMMRDEILRSGVPSTTGEKDRIETIVVQNAEMQFKSRIRMEKRGKWNDKKIFNDIKGKVGGLMRRVMDGSLKYKAPRKKAEKTIPIKDMLSEAGYNIDDFEQNREINFIRSMASRASGQRRASYKIEEGVAEDLSLPEDRSKIENSISEGLSKAFTSFFEDVYGDKSGINTIAIKNRIHILRAPTGAGKTSQCIRRIAEDPRTFEQFGGENGDNAPIIMLIPTYNNIDELRSRVDLMNIVPGDKESMEKYARDHGLVSEDNLEEVLNNLEKDAKGCGLNAMTYRGKILAGCRMKEKVDVMQKAGIGSSALCRTTVYEQDGKEMRPVEKICEFYDVCEAIAQRKQISQSHVVFLPHAFMSLEIPDELKSARAVIADERIHHLFLHSTELHVSTLNAVRGHIRIRDKNLTSEQREDLQNEMLLMREDACNIVIKALDDGICPASVFYDMGPDETKSSESIQSRGYALIDAAITICKDNIRREARITPDMSLDEIKDHCSHDAGKELNEELKLWEIIRDRMDGLSHDELLNQAQDKTTIRSIALMDEIRNTTDEDEKNRLKDDLSRVEEIRKTLVTRKRKANGDKDYRIQKVYDEGDNNDIIEKIRISWRTTPNWIDKPFLLLDASSAPAIISKIWNREEKDIVVHNIVDDIGKALNVKVVAVIDSTYSDSTYIPREDMEATEKSMCAKRLSDTRQALNLLSAMYGHGRVVAGSSIKLRTLINHDWAGPGNIDWCHFGAMRGLDMFKHHAAAVSIGRMEIPTRAIDGLVASLTYDDAIPEKPFDLIGNGKKSDGSALRLPMEYQRNRLRDSKIVAIKVPMQPGKWARLLQKQSREEELSQFLGRLRPVYRKGQVPYWFCFSSILPDEVIVDDVITMDDLLTKRTPIWDSLRMANGVVCAEQFAKQGVGLYEPDENGCILNDVKKHLRLFADNKEEFFEREESEDEPPRKLDGFKVFEWTLDNPLPGMTDEEKSGIIYVQGYIADTNAKLHISETLIESGKVFPGFTFTLNKLKDTISTNARPRPEDTIDKKIGTRDDRKNRERMEREMISRFIMNGSIKVDTSGIIMRLDSSRGKLTLSEYIAMDSIESFLRGGFPENDDDDENDDSIIDEIAI